LLQHENASLFDPQNGGKAMRKKAVSTDVEPRENEETVPRFCSGRELGA